MANGLRPIEEGRIGVILAEEGAWGTWRFRDFVQWLVPSEGGQLAVRAITELLVGVDVQAPWDGAQFGYKDGRWYVIVPSVRRTGFNKTRWLKFEAAS